MRPFDANGYFRPVGNGNGGLRQLAVRGAGISLFSGGVGLAIQIVSTAVLARILVPQDFGLVAMATTFSLLLANFGLNGFTEAIVQRSELSRAATSNLFWVNLAIGVVLTIVFAAAGSLMAAFYHEPRVTRVAVGISLSILATSLSVLHLALLKRAMLFSIVSVNDICARLISVGVSIALGIAGFGYWALVAGAIALPLSTAIGAWMLCRWLPSLPRRAEGTRDLVMFALHTYGFFSVNYFARNLDNLLVGWRFSAQALGFYKKAYDLFVLSSSQVSTSLTVVVLSALSRLNRDFQQYKRYFLGAVAVLAFVGMGLAGDLTLVGKDLIRVLLGPGWKPAGQIFTFFAPGIGIMLIYLTYGWIHLSIGRPDRRLRWSLIEFAVTAILFLIALPWGPEGVAVAWTASYVILIVPAFWYAGRPVQLGVAPVLGTIWRYAVAALIAGLLSAAIVHAFPQLAGERGILGAVNRIVVNSLLFGVLYCGAVVLLHGGWTPIREFMDLLREMLPSNFGRLPEPALTAADVSTVSSAAVEEQRELLLSSAVDEEADPVRGAGAPLVTGPVNWPGGD